MSIRNKYEAELAQVFDKLVTMCRETERAIDRSVEALVCRNPELSRAVIDDTSRLPTVGLFSASRAMARFSPVAMPPSSLSGTTISRSISLFGR